MTKSNSKTLYLIDGSSYLFRAFYALPSLSNAKGEPTGALLGVLNMIRKLIADNKPDYIGVVFDAKGPTFRNEMFEDYKANRPPMPDELRPQIKPLLEIVEILGLPLLQIAGVEADDVIGTLAIQAEAQGLNVVISTGDKDLAQLVNRKITLINTMNNSRLDIQGVIDKFGVKPEQIVDYLALIGDTADNIPGIPKVGPKTAAKWLANDSNVASIIDNANSFTGKVGENLRSNIEQLKLSYDLATLRTNLELPLCVDQLLAREPNTDELRKRLHYYGFTTWLRQLDGEEAPIASETISSKHNTTQFEIIHSKEKLAQWIDLIKSKKLLALDTETTSIDPMQAKLVGLSLSVEAGYGAYIPIAHSERDSQQLPLEYVLQELKILLSDPSIQLIGQHIKYDMNILARHGVVIDHVDFDTMLESYVLYSSTASRHNMTALAKKYLGRDTIEYEMVAGKGAKQISFADVPIEKAAQYAAEDADVTFQLHQELWPKLAKNTKLLSVYTQHEARLIPVLARMERTGVLIDTELLKQQSIELNAQLIDLEKTAHELAGEAFNLGSPKQLQHILFDKLKLPILRKTPSKQPSTAEDVLQELAQNYPLPETLIKYRSVAKLLSTYIDKLPLQINQDTGRIHTNYHQAIAATGRLSSTQPNLQNIPIRTAQGRRIRQAFIAPKRWIVFAADYSQIELRIMAHLSQDTRLLSAFHEGIDVHSATAAEVFGDDPNSVKPENRRAAKAINFGLMYGMSAFGLAKQLKIKRSDAKNYITAYFNRYPGVKAFMESTRQQCHEQGYVETVFGRRLYLPEINSGNPIRRQAAERAAINAPMQGSAADIIKRAMIDVDSWLNSGEVKARMLMQVHDELVLEVREAHRDEVIAEVVKRMEQAATLDVPLVVDTGYGPNWDVAH